MRDFDVRGVLGKGQFATVFHCRHKKSGEDCAIKRYDRPFRNRSERESLLNEAKILDDLREGEGNAYVTDVNTAWQEEGILYIWMELCDRGSLASLKDRLVDQGLFKKLPNSTIWFIVHDVSAGIAHMHQKNIVHLDIKPSNIFLSHSGRLKLGDFGTAIRAGEEQDGRDGDGRYLAPELLNSAVRDLEADLFSFGVMLYEWAGGIEDTLPSEGYEWRQLRKGIMKEIFPTHRDERLVQLTKELLSPEPGDRPSAESILAECDPLDPYEPSPDPILTSVPSIFEEEEEASMLSMTVLSSGSDDQRVVTPTAFSLRKS
jgi:serine/threonine protein kinase